MSRRVPFLAFLALLAALAGCARTTPAPQARSATAPRAVADSRPLTYVQIDVGQGDSELVVSPDGHAMLVDGGPPGRVDEILRALASQNVKRLDVAVASHPHNDHIGSLDDVVSRVPVDRFLDSGYNLGSDAQQRLLRAVKERGVPFELARAGQSFALGDSVTVAVLAPRMPLFANTQSDANNNSVVLKVSYGGVRLLLTGDLEVKGRERLYADGADLKAEVYKVAHHGSHNGTDAALLERIRPRVALVSCQLGNDYGHPHREALEALTSASVPIYRTDLQGTLILTSDGRTWQVTTERGATADVTRPGREIKRGEGPGGATDQGGDAGNDTMDRGGDEKRSSGPAPGAAFVGNRRSKVYHPAGSRGRVPAPENRIYFRTEEEARRAGYRPVGSVNGGGRAGGSR
jgi:competence protein ComEC